MAKKVKYTQPLLGEVNAAGYLILVPGAVVSILQDGAAVTVYSDEDGTAITTPSLPSGVASGVAGVSTRGELTVWLEPGSGYSGVSTVGQQATTFPIPDISPDISDVTAAAATRASNAQTVDYTLVLADAGKAIDVNSASARNVTIPLLSSVAFPIGTLIEVAQKGAGQVTIVPTGGVTLSGSTTTPAQNGSVYLRKTATNSWHSVSVAPSGTYVPSAGDVDIAGAKTFLNGLHVNDGDFGTQRAFTIQTREALPTTPVPVFRPVATDEIIALDICPNGTPVAPGTPTEIAWFDVCDADVSVVPNLPVVTARVGARGDYIEFGSKAFDGAAAKPVWFTTANGVVLKFGTDHNIDGQQDRNAVTAFRLRNATPGVSAFVELQARADVATGTVRTYSSAFSYDGSSYASFTDLANDAAGVTVVAGGAAGVIHLLTGGITSAFRRVTITAAGTVQVAKSLEARRFAGKGTALTAGNFALSAGWGTTATVNNISATEQGGKFGVTSNGTGQADSPTVTITFPEAYPQAPVVLVVRNGGNSGSTMPTFTSSTTTLTITFPMTPVAANNYLFAFIVL